MDDTIRLALETISLNKQAIVFVSSRSSAEKTAEDISKLIDKNDPYLSSSGSIMKLLISTKSVS